MFIDKWSLRSLGVAFRRHLEGLWCPRGHFWWFARVSKYHRKFGKFRGFPGTPGSEVIRQVESRNGGVVSLQFQNILAVKIQATRLKAVNSQDQKDLQGCKFTNIQEWKDLQGCKLTNCKHILHRLMAHKGPADIYIDPQISCWGTIGGHLERFVLLFGDPGANSTPEGAFGDQMLFTGCRLCRRPLQALRNRQILSCYFHGLSLIFMDLYCFP